MRPFDFRCVPRLAQPLTTILNLRAILFANAGAELCEERGAHATPALTNIKPDDFCPDGFHAGEKGFQKWAEQLSNHMMKKF
jgi:lysophospholipase L1-like esterase